MTLRAQLRRAPLLGYFALTFIGSWRCWALSPAIRSQVRAGRLSSTQALQTGHSAIDAGTVLAAALIRTIDRFADRRWQLLISHCQAVDMLPWTPTSRRVDYPMGPDVASSVFFITRAP